LRNFVKTGSSSRKYRWWPIWLSLFIHALLVVILVYFKKEYLPETQSSPIEVTVIEKPAGSPKVKSKLNLAQNHQTAKNIKTLPGLHQLAPAYENHSQSGQGSSEAGSDDTAAPWGSGSSDFQKISEYNLMERIHHQVEGLLYYPGVLASHKIEGAVNARLVFNKQGHCDWPRTQISSGSPYFRVFILDLLKTLCQQSYPREIHGRQTTVVDLSFLFTLTEHDSLEIKDQQSHIVGNVLMFYRNSHQSIAQWRLGPFTGMFPLPFVNLDFSWLKEHWDTYIEHKDALAPFKE
jgi:hypothetical protein